MSPQVVYVHLEGFEIIQLRLDTLELIHINTWLVETEAGGS